MMKTTNIKQAGIKQAIYTLALLTTILSPIVQADTVIINNYPNGQASSSSSQSPCASDMNTQTDPRVPPAGTYTTKNSDGSSNTTYTTGDKKPYYLDNNCNNNNSANSIQPQVLVVPNNQPLRR